MLKTYYSIIGLLLFTSLNGQIISIPDSNFKSKLLASDSFNHFAEDISGNSIQIDSNNNGEIEVSEALNVYALNVSNNSLPNLISDLTGIIYFSNLTSLDCSSNQLTSLTFNANNSNLLELNCYNNQISFLNILSLHNLTKLECGSNLLTSLNVYDPLILTYLDYNDNQIPNLNLQQFPNLELLGCGGNQIQSLNLSGLNNLLTLDCTGNLLQNLNVNNLTHLQSLRCDYNQLQNLNLANNIDLYILYCNNNILTSLILPNNPSLESYIYISNNLLSQLNVPNVKTIVCNNNQLTNLNFIYPSTLNRLECKDNLFTEIDLSLCNRFQIDGVNCSNNPFLQNLNIKNGLHNLYNGSPSLLTGLRFENCPQLQFICVDNIVSEENLIQTLITQYGYTNCNYNSYCSFTPGGVYYTINGSTKFDIDNNGCNVNDVNYPNLNFSISDGINSGNAIANISGNYSLPVQAGTHIITPILENPNYFIVTPSTATHTFPSSSSSINQDFCVIANGVHSDLEVVLLPINLAIPGFDIYYKIIFKNKGTNTQSGFINLTFNDTILDYVSASSSVTSQTTNNLTWNFSNLAPFESRTIDVTLNLNSPLETPPSNSGDILNYTATVNGLTDETAIDNLSTLNQTVVNSLDPNDKTCIEGMVIEPSLVGQYVHYMIRFENDGTANAQNVVVKDIIDTTKYDIATLVPINGSASFTTRIRNTNQVEFIFQNINLPYTIGSNQGFVAFKIKTKPTLVLGDTFSNTANIYFDYNAPIITNTATTTIAALASPKFVFSDYFTLSPVPAKDVLNINTKDNIIISSLSLYNSIGQILFIIYNPNKSIDVSTLKSGSYFMKVISDKGANSIKFIKE